MGSKVSQTKRLLKIKTFAETVLVKEYRLAYQEVHSIKTSILSSIQEFDGLGNAMSAVQFEWDQGESSFGIYKKWMDSGSGLHLESQSGVLTILEGQDIKGIIMI